MKERVIDEETLRKVVEIISTATIHFPVRSRVLEEILKIGGPELREVIGEMRNRKMPVGSGTSGYWWAYGPEELETTIRHLESRIRKESHHIKMLKSIYPGSGVQMALQL